MNEIISYLATLRSSHGEKQDRHKPREVSSVGLLLAENVKCNCSGYVTPVSASNAQVVGNHVLDV